MFDKFAWLVPGLLRLFSGGGSGGGTTTTTTQNFSPEEAARRTAVMDEAANVFNSSKGTIAGSPYPGAVVAPASLATTAAQNLAVTNAANAQEGIQQINAGVKYGLGDAMDVSKNPYLQNAIQAAITPITQKYTDPGGIMGNIRTGANMAGQSFGGSRQGVAEGVAAGRYAQEVGDTASKMANDAYLTGQNTFSKTLAFAPQALEAGQMPVNWLSGVGAQQENLAQQQENYNADARMWGLNAPWAPVQNYANIVFGGATPSTTSQSSGGGSQRSPLMGMAGGAMQGYSLGGPMGAVLGGILGMF